MIETTFPTAAKRVVMLLTDRRGRCRIDGCRFRFDVRLAFRPNGTALTMERFHALVALAAAHPTTAETIADWLRFQVGAELPVATHIGVWVRHHPNRAGVDLQVWA
jgi:hypothetical protein